jgi:hypothetical protein
MGVSNRRRQVPHVAMEMMAEGHQHRLGQVIGALPSTRLP